MGTREPERADVGRSDPGGAEERRADDDLRRATADIDDGDDLGQIADGPGDGAVVGEAALALGRQHANGQRRRLRERRRQLGAAAPWRPGAVTITVARSTPSSAIRRA